MRDRLIASNQARGVKLPKQPPRRNVYLTAEQLQRLADESGRYKSLVLVPGVGGLRLGETAWRNGAWYAARLCPTPLRPEERRAIVADHERDGIRLQIRTPGDLESMELVASDRVPPGPGQIEVAVSASSINFADVLVAFGRYPAFEGRLPQLGTDFAGVVTAVGPEVRDHKVGDHVGGLSLNELPLDEWPTRLRRLISDQVSLILRRSVDPDRPLSGYGLDSLGALELRTRIETETGIRLTSTDITTIRGLAGLLCEKLAPAEAA